MPSEDAQWMIEQGLSPKPKQFGREVPAIPPRLLNADMKKAIDTGIADAFGRDLSALVDDCTKEGERELNERILDCMDEGKISPPQAARLLKALFRKFDGGPGMCRVDADGEIHQIDTDGGENGR